MMAVWALVLAGILTLLPGPAAGYSKAASYLIGEQIALACDGNEGKIDPAAVIEQDLTGDGKADLIISHEGITCSGGEQSGRSLFCGMQVCAVNIYVRHGPVLTLKAEMLGGGVRVGGGPIPTITMHGHGGGSRSLRWNGRDFR